jgi:hypothetical protein
VKAVYGGSEVIKSLTVPVRSFESTLPTISGPDVICNEEEYTVNGLGPGYSLEWSCTRNLLLKSTSENSAVFTSIGTGPNYIRANVITPCGDEITLRDKSVTTGPETPQNLTVLDPVTNATPSDLFTHTPYLFRVGFYPSTDPNDYKWEAQYEKENGSIIKFLIPPGPTNQLEFSADYPYPVKYTISVTYNNGCGFGNRYSCYYYFTGSGLLSLMIHPNPAGPEVNISVEEKSDIEDLFGINPEVSNYDKITDWEMIIYDQNQVVKEIQKCRKGLSAKVQTSGWKKGFYVVKVKYEDKVLTGNLVVNR